MDQRVLEALAKWPNVPACAGWLALDRRGQWRMRDEACQAVGGPGEPIRHPALKAFIERNYESDDEGRWFFQNGPQRVFVDLAYTPSVVRLHDDASADGLRLIDQCGATFDPDACWLDEQGNVLFSRPGTRPTIALLHDHDLGLCAERFEWGAEARDEPAALRWANGSLLPVGTIAVADVPARFGFVQQPAP